MKRLLVGLGTINILWVLVSIGGVVLDTTRLAMWSQHLMASLLVGVVLVPLLVFAYSIRQRSQAANAQPPDDAPEFVSSDANRASALHDAPSAVSGDAYSLPASPASSVTTAPRTASTTTPAPSIPSTASTASRSSAASTSAASTSASWGRRLIHTASVALGLWLFVSLFGLFLDAGHLTFWTQSVMVAFLVTIAWTPVLVFFANPFDATTSDFPAPRARVSSDDAPPSEASEVLDFMAERGRSFVDPLDTADFPDDASDAFPADDVDSASHVAPTPSSARASFGLREKGDAWPEWPEES